MNFGNFAQYPGSSSSGTKVGPGRSVRALTPRVAGQTLQDPSRAMAVFQGSNPSEAPLKRRSAREMVQQARETGYIDPIPFARLTKALEEIRGGMQDISDRVARLEQRRFPAQGGPVSSGVRDRNLAAATHPPEVGKGGVLSTESATLGAGAAADTTAEASITSSTRSRLTGTVIEYVSIIATGDLADPEELQKVEVRMLINGRPLPSVDRVPADVFSPSLDGPQLIPVGEYVGSDAEITVEFRVTDDLDTAAAEEIKLRMYAGDGSSMY
jgi:hypothetical protein